MSDLKAYACLETYENTGAILFAKSNIEARKASANEFNDGELAGMSVTRAPWADKYGSRSAVPISVMVDHGWHFECVWSGIRIDADLYDHGFEIYNEEKGHYEYDDFLLGKEPVGFQDGPCFACQEYADLYQAAETEKKIFEEKQLEYFRAIVLKNLPDAILEDKPGYMRNERISSLTMKDSNFVGSGPRYTHSVHIPFSFPGMKYWAALKFGQPDYGKYGPRLMSFICANGDVEEFTSWCRKQKEKRSK